jgi:hypothetical protein
VEFPDVLHSNGIGKHRANGVKLQFGVWREYDETNRPVKIDSATQQRKMSESERMASRDIVRTSPLVAHEALNRSKAA